MSPLVKPDRTTWVPVTQLPMALSVTVVPVWLVAVTGALVPGELEYAAFPLTTPRVPL